jgi:hypothetical protein
MHKCSGRGLAISAYQNIMVAKILSANEKPAEN